MVKIRVRAKTGFKCLYSVKAYFSEMFWTYHIDIVVIFSGDIPERDSSYNHRYGTFQRWQKDGAY